MKTLTAFISLLLIFSCKEDNAVVPIEPIDPTNQDHIDNIILNSGVDMGFSIVQASTGEGGAFQDKEMTIRADSHLDKVAALKGFGARPWNTPNLLLLTQDNFDKSDVWFSEELDSNGDPIGSHGLMLMRDRGNGYQYLKIYNGPGYRLDTNPGRIEPEISNPIDIIQVMRVFPCVPSEADGLLDYGNLENNWDVFFRTNRISTGVSGGIHNLVYFRITIDENGNWEVRLNDLDKNVPDASGSDFNFTDFEQFVGSNGHPVEQQWFCRLYNFGEFAQADLDLLQTSFEALWPLGLPDYPHDDGGLINSSFFDRDNKTWESPVGTFGGGDGVAGDYIYRWFYHSKDPSVFPRQNRLDDHGLIDPDLVPSASTRFLSRNEMVEAGVFYANGIEVASSDVLIMSVRIPVDSTGVVGEPIQSNWTIDNIQ